jgi:hypothetical protein
LTLLLLLRLLLLLLLLLQGSEVWVYLSHPWSDCPIAVGDAANIIGGVAGTDEAGRALLYLSGSQGLLVLHPDVLLSGETVCSLVHFTFNDLLEVVTSCWLLVLLLSGADRCSHGRQSLCNVCTDSLFLLATNLQLAMQLTANNQQWKLTFHAPICVAVLPACLTHQAPPSPQR